MSPEGQQVTDVYQDRRGVVEDGLGRALSKLRQRPDSSTNPLTGPNAKVPLPFAEAIVEGRVYKAPRWRATGRVVLPNSTLSSTASDVMAEAEGLASAEAKAIAAVCKWDVPQGMICVVDFVRVRFGDNTALKHVRCALVDGGQQGSIAQSGNEGLALTYDQQFFSLLDGELEVDYRANPGRTVKLLVQNQDTEVPHLVEASIEGFMFPYSILNPGADPDLTK
jgi:hypothetical protein